MNDENVLDEDAIDMNDHCTGLEYNDLVFVDCAARLDQIKTPFLSEISVSSDDEETKFSLHFPLQY